MKKIIIAIVVAASFSVSEVYAGNAEGDVGKVLVGRLGDEVYVELLNATITQFACSSAHPSGYRYAFSLKNHAAGKEMLATILAAKAAGKRISVQGAGICSIDPSIEDLAYVVSW